MSRFGGDYGEDEWSNLNWGRWANNIKQILNGKRGRKVLLEMEQALLALPEPRLIAGKLCEITEGEDGAVKAEFCVIGAYAAFKGAEPEELAKRYLEDGSYETAMVGQEHGMQYTLAWTLGDLNDEDFAQLTPEGRYDEILGWVRSKLAVAV